MKHVRTGLPVHSTHKEDAIAVGRSSVQLPVKHVRTGLPVHSTHEEEAVAAEFPTERTTAVAFQPLAMQVTEYDRLAGEACPNRFRAADFVAAADTVST